MRVLDIGANVGYFTLLAASLIGAEGFVYSWEPSPANVKRLYASQLLNEFSNIAIMQAAATDKTSLLKYFRNHSNGNAAELTGMTSQDMSSLETIMGLRIDDFISPDIHLDFVKIDVEGFEAEVIRGCSHHLKLL